MLCREKRKSSTSGCSVYMLRCPYEVIIMIDIAWFSSGRVLIPCAKIRPARLSSVSWLDLLPRGRGMRHLPPRTCSSSFDLDGGH